MEQKRVIGLDALRLICILMLATYHFLNYYGTQFLSIGVSGAKGIFAQNFFWGGGRLICNVFLYISAWFLCEKHFSVERLFKTWITVFLYSILVGLYFLIKYNEVPFFVRHLFPVSTNQVWYVSMYIGLLIISPLLNILLNDKYRFITRKVLIVFLIMQCVIPSFDAKYTYPGTILSWFVVAYLMVGVIKKDGIKISTLIKNLIFLMNTILIA